MDNNNNDNDNNEHDKLFLQFARAVCRASCVPRKEVLEAWAMALYVQEQFPNLKRFADLACGHGLVSWALLLLSTTTTESAKSTNQNNNNTTNTKDDSSSSSSSSSPLLSALCIDIRMPGSAERVANVFLQEWPEFQDRWHYVEGSVDAIQPASSTLLLGVHACGTLSDRIVALAIRGQSPLALVPCCHSKKSLTMATTTLTREAIGDINNVDFQQQWSNGNLASFLDGRRMQDLELAGFDVHEVFLPKEITPKNRLIVAYPPNHNNNNNKTTANVDTTNPDTIVPVIADMLKSYQMPKIAIPVADTPLARSIIATKLAGKAAALERKKSPSPKLSMSIHMPMPSSSSITGSSSSSNNNEGERGEETKQRQQQQQQQQQQQNEEQDDLTLEKLQAWIDGETSLLEAADETKSSNGDGNGEDEESKEEPTQPRRCRHDVKVSYVDSEPYANPTTGRRTRTFQFTYPRGMSKQDAKTLHIGFCHQVPTVFPGTVVRQVPR